MTWVAYLCGQCLLSTETLRIRHNGRSVWQLWRITGKDNTITIHGHRAQLARRSKRHHIASVIVVNDCRKQLYKIANNLPAVDIKIIRGLPSSTAGNSTLSSSSLSVCLSVCLHSLTCMAIARQCSAPDTVAMPRCAGSSSRGSSKTATTIALYTFPFSLQLKIGNITLTFCCQFTASSRLDWFRHKNQTRFTLNNHQHILYFVFLILVSVSILLFSVLRLVISSFVSVLRFEHFICIVLWLTLVNVVTSCL